MDRALRKLPAGALIGTVLLAMGTVFPHSASQASMQADGGGLFSAGMGCGPAETLVGTGAARLLARIRADNAGSAPHRRKAVEARTARRLEASRTLRSMPATRRFAGKVPRAEQEPRSAVLRSFYTCNAASAPNPAAGTGWRLVGPMRRS